MRFWDYFPHPVEHPGWFFGTVTTVGALIAGLCGASDMMCAIWVSGIGLNRFVKVANWFYHGVDKPGYRGMLMRYWLMASAVWSCAFLIRYAENPSYDGLMMLLWPWVISVCYLLYIRVAPLDH